MGQCAPEDSISQCPFLQMIDTAGNPHADGSAAPGARPRHRPSRHRDPPATSRSHDNWMAARQTSCRQQTAPPQPRCSKDVTAHPHRPGARPGRPCQVPARSGQPLSGRSASTARDPTLHTTWWTLTIYLDQQLYSDVQRIHVFPPPASTGLHTRTPAQSRSPKPGTERVAPCID